METDEIERHEPPFTLGSLAFAVSASIALIVAYAWLLIDQSSFANIF